MKPTSPKTLPCAIFGHNYIRTKTNIDHSIELTCVHCDMVEVTDHKGNFDAHTVSNNRIKETLEELYKLKQRFYKIKVS